MSRAVKLSLFIGLALVLTACATQPLPPTIELPGFFTGLLHGAIAPFAFIVGLFTDVRIYAFPNSGLWYDFGFLLGMGIIWGGGGAATAR